MDMPAIELICDGHTTCTQSQIWRLSCHISVTLAMQPSLSFAPITAEEWRAQVVHTAVAFNSTVTPRPPPQPKRPVGRPKRQLDANTVLAAAAAASNSYEDQPAKKQKTRGQYTDWFRSPYINDIMRAYERSDHRPKLALDQLKVSAPDARFERLTHTTIMRWYDEKHQLKPQYKAHLESGLENVRQNGFVRAFEEFPAVEEEIKQTLLRMRAAGTSINSSIIRWVMQGIIGLRAPDSRLTLLALGQPFICAWARAQLKWSWRKSTTAASKLPLDWEEQGVQMAMRIAAKMELKKVSSAQTLPCHRFVTPAHVTLL